MNKLKQNLKGILALHKKLNIEEELSTFLKEEKKKLEKTPEARELFLKELYKTLKEERENELLWKLFSPADVAFIAERIAERIKQSNPHQERFSEIEKDDVDILREGIDEFIGKSDNQAELVENLKKILKNYSSFIELFFIKSTFNLTTLKGIKAFLENSNLLEIVFYSTLGLFKYNSAYLKDNRGLFQQFLFENYFLYESFYNEFYDLIQKIAVFLTIFWVLLRKPLQLNSNISILLKKEPNRKFNVRVRDLLNKIFENFLQLDNELIELSFKTLINYELIYALFENLENVSSAELPNIEKLREKISTETLQLFLKEDRIIGKNLNVLIDFSILLKSYSEQNYFNLIKSFAQKDKLWFREIVLKNLNENYRSSDTINFLLLDAVKDSWTEDIEKSSLKFLREKLTTKEGAQEVLRGNLQFELLKELINRKKRLNLVYTNFGAELFKLVSTYLKEGEKEENETVVEFFLGKISYLLNKKGVDTFIEKIMDFIEDNIANIRGEKLERLLNCSKKMRDYITQRYLEEIGKKLIASKCDLNLSKNFLILLNYARNFKDSIGLRKEIKECARLFKGEEVFEKIEKMLIKKKK